MKDKDYGDWGDKRQDISTSAAAILTFFEYEITGAPC